MVRKALLALTVTVALVVGAGLPAAQADSATHSGDGRHGDRHGDYLALGDSVPFGFNPLLPTGSDPAKYVGYPELAARKLELRLTNLSCPGQTTAGFLSLTGSDNGCFPFRSVAALHSAYSGTQLAAALAFLAAHPRTRLVSLTLGANDVFLCQKATADRCASPAEFGATLRSAAANLTVALTAIRKVYQGPLVAVTYYTSNYADPAGVAAIGALDAALAGVVTGFGGSVADGFAAWQKAAAAAAGDSCVAGLLIALPTGGCDVHPTPRGARLLAGALARRAGQE